MFYSHYNRKLKAPCSCPLASRTCILHESGVKPIQKFSFNVWLAGPVQLKMGSVSIYIKEVCCWRTRYMLINPYFQDTSSEKSTMQNSVYNVTFCVTRKRTLIFRFTSPRIRTSGSIRVKLRIGVTSGGQWWAVTGEKCSGWGHTHLVTDHMKIWPHPRNTKARGLIRPAGRCGRPGSSPQVCGWDVLAGCQRAVTLRFQRVSATRGGSALHPRGQQRPVESLHKSLSIVVHIPWRSRYPLLIFKIGFSAFHSDLGAALDVKGAALSTQAKPPLSRMHWASPTSPAPRLRHCLRYYVISAANATLVVPQTLKREELQSALAACEVVRGPRSSRWQRPGKIPGPERGGR